MDSRYFVLPEVGSGAEGDPFRPKYLFETVEGQLQPRPEVEKFYGGEAFEKAGSDWHIVRVFTADPANLDLLASQSDAYEVDPSVLVTALNGSGMFPVDLTPREWALLFSKILMQ